MMDPIHKKVLANKTALIMESISNPTVLSGYLAEVFNTADREEIDAKYRQYGATIGTQTLLSLLEKRGRKAFPLLIRVLRNPEMKQDELATALEDEEKKLRGGVGVPMRRVQSLPPSNEESEDNGYAVCSPPPPYSAPVVNSNGMYNFSEGQQSPVGKQAPVAEINSQAQQGQSPVKSDSLVKDIPYRLRNRIEKMMNQYDVHSHDWKGLAGAMKLSADDVRQLESGKNGKMTGLFDKMIHTKKTIDDLLALLKHDDVQRLDVIDEIVKECDLPKELLESESSEVQETASAAVASSVEETLISPTTKSKSLPFPRQESQEAEEFDTKPDARTPSQVENDDNPEGAVQSDTKPDARTPSQVEDDNNPKDRAQSDTKPDARTPSQVEDDDNPKDTAQIVTKPDARVPSQVENDEEPDVNSKPTLRRLPHMISNDGDDDVFDSTGQAEVKKHALLISCCGKSKIDKMHDIELRNLEGVIEDSGWIVKRYTKCEMSNLMRDVHFFLRNLTRESRRFISFVYLVGPTVHINGENYLLPADLKHPSSQADLIHNALNINWLVSQLSRNYMQVVIVDGALKDAITDVSLRGVLQGLAPIHPPPNAVIAFPCHPGYIRPEQERLYYIKSVVKNLQDTENTMLADLFDKVRGELKEKHPDMAACSLPVEFSLSSALLPLCVNPGDNEELQVPSWSKAACHAILVSNSNYNGLDIKTNQCLKDCEKLRMALLKCQWVCDGEICNKSAKEIMDELRQALNRLGDKDEVVMVYFMGYTRTIMDCNYFIGKDFTVESADLLSSSVPLKWVLDLMCEKLRGPKILIVDDLSTAPKGLEQMTAPLDVMISLPKRDDSRHYDASFTSNFAGLLETNAGKLSLKEMVKKAASFDRHHLSSSLYFN